MHTQHSTHRFKYPFVCVWENQTGLLRVQTLTQLPNCNSSPVTGSPNHFNAVGNSISTPETAHLIPSTRRPLHSKDRERYEYFPYGLKLINGVQSCQYIFLSLVDFFFPSDFLHSFWFRIVYVGYDIQ